MLKRLQKEVPSNGTVHLSDIFYPMSAIPEIPSGKKRILQTRCLVLCAGTMESKKMYYAPNTHPAIISKEEYNAVQTLIKCRAMRKQVQERSPFDKKIFCEKCGLSFRKKVSHEKLFWICRSHANDAKSCTVTQILNTEIEQAFLHLYHKLRHQGYPFSPNCSQTSRAPGRQAALEPGHRGT